MGCPVRFVLVQGLAVRAGCNVPEPAAAGGVTGAVAAAAEELGRSARA